MTGFAILLLFPVCMIIATFSDLTTMKIPNKAILILLAGFVILAPVAGMALPVLGIHLGVAAAVFAIGFILWMFGTLGAGDVKLLAATSLWLGPVQTVPYLLYVGLIGGASVVALLIFRRVMLPAFLVQVDWVYKLHQPKADVPYGIALGPAALLVFFESPLAVTALASF